MLLARHAGTAASWGAEPQTLSRGHPLIALLVRADKRGAAGVLPVLPLPARAAPWGKRRAQALR
jgi:hypothetical protein